MKYTFKVALSRCIDMVFELADNCKETNAVLATLTSKCAQCNTSHDYRATNVHPALLLPLRFWYIIIFHVKIFNFLIGAPIYMFFVLQYSAVYVLYIVASYLKIKTEIHNTFHCNIKHVANSSTFWLQFKSTIRVDCINCIAEK